MGKLYAIDTEEGLNIIYMTHTHTFIYYIYITKDHATFPI